jgi:hypothetical protein
VKLVEIDEAGTGPCQDVGHHQLPRHPPHAGASS